MSIDFFKLWMRDVISDTKKLVVISDTEKRDVISDTTKKHDVILILIL